MKHFLTKICISVILISLVGCSNNKLTYINPDSKILFLHHSTGLNVWKGEIKGLAKYTKRVGPSLVPELLKDYNQQNGKKYSVKKKRYPNRPYPWANYPYDYYNIWVMHGDKNRYMKKPTLKLLAPNYDVIIFKYCYPYSNILPDDSIADINSSKKTSANYTLQYNALKNKLREFPETKFLVWTGAALVESATSPDEAQRARDFNKWVINEWDEPGDNIFIFDFREIETEGGLYLKPEYAAGIHNSHPNETLSVKAAKLFVNRIIDVIENY